MHRGLAAAAIACSLLALGCGRELDTAKVAPDPTTGLVAGELRPEQRAALQTSTALTKAGSPGAVVATFIEDVGTGAGPVVFSAYDPKVPERIGSENLLGSLRVMQSIVANTQVAVVSRRETSSGVLVKARLVRIAGADTTYAFVLRPKGKSWEIAYDSLLAQALQAHVTEQAASQAGKPTTADVRAGQRAVTDLGLSSLALEAQGRSGSSGRTSRRPSSSSSAGSEADADAGAEPDATRTSTTPSDG